MHILPSYSLGLRYYHRGMSLSCIIRILKQCQRISILRFSSTMPHFLSWLVIKSISLIWTGSLRNFLWRPGQREGFHSWRMSSTQTPSWRFTSAMFMAVISSKLPQVGKLLLMRLISQFWRSYKRIDKACIWYCFFLNLRRWNWFHRLCATPRRLLSPT